MAVHALSRATAFALIAIAFAGLQGCALSYVDRSGDTHYRGLLVHVVVPKSADQREVRAESVRVTSFGLSVLSGLQRTNITLGYNDDTLVLVRGDSCLATRPRAQEPSLAPELAFDF